jgi:AcrR family transcriptional regulator
MPSPITPLAKGLRERKKLKTRESIQREAMRLFRKNGYDKTTIEQIAAAVEISPSTFFNYFPSKEDVVLYDAYDPVVASLLIARPPDERLSVSVRAVLLSMAAVFEQDRDIILARSKLVIEEPALRALLWEQLEKARDLICGVIAQRYGRDPDDLDVRIVVMALLAGVMEATREWARLDGRVPMSEFLNRAVDLVGGDHQLDAITSRKVT